MNSSIQELIIKNLHLNGYSDTEANTLLTYLIDATNNQLDNKEYLEFLKLIIKAELNSIENHELSSPNPEKSMENYTKNPIFKIHENYSRNDIHNLYFGKDYPRIGSGNWIIFAEI